MNNTTLETRPPANTCIACGSARGERSKYCTEKCAKSYRYNERKLTASKCNKPDCERPVQARGMCGSHYGQWHRNEGGKLFTYTCVGCAKVYRTRRKAQSRNRFCTADCQRAYTATNEQSKAKSAETRAKRPDPVIECAWCKINFQAKTRAAKYCTIDCRDKARADRRSKSISTLRLAYECNDYDTVLSEIKSRSVIKDNGCWEWEKLDKSGYPRMVIAKKSLATHRVSLECKHGKPLGEQAAHHICANTKCVNPDHLQPVTHRENIAEMLARNYYLNRIKELESVVRELAPGHEILNRIEMA